MQLEKILNGFGMPFILQGAVVLVVMPFIDRANALKWFNMAAKSVFDQMQVRPFFDIPFFSNGILLREKFKLSDEYILAVNSGIEKEMQTAFRGAGAGILGHERPV